MMDSPRVSQDCGRFRHAVQSPDTFIATSDVLRPQVAEQHDKFREMLGKNRATSRQALSVHPFSRN